MGISSAKFGLLFAVMSFVNAITAPVGGFLMDKFGLLIGLYLAVASIFVGQLLLGLAAYLGSYNLMFFGRFVFGLGFEPINSVKNIVVAQWFIGAELSLASNLNLSTSRMFVFVNGYLTPLITERHNYTSAFVFGLVFALISLLAAIPVSKLHRKLKDESLSQE